MIICCTANKLSFGTCKLSLKAIVKNICQFDVCKTGIKYIIRKIEIENLLIHLHWVRGDSELLIYDWKDVVLPDE